MARKKLEELRKTRNYSIRFDSYLKYFIESHPNKSKFINELIRKEKERIEQETDI